MALQWYFVTVFLLTINVHGNCGAETDGRDTVVEDPDIASSQGHSGTNTRAMSYINLNVGTYALTLNTLNKRGKCVYEVSVTRSGAEDVIDLPCSAGQMDTLSSNDDFLIANEDTVKKFSVYGKTNPDRLQVINEGLCSVRTFTDSGTVPSSAVVGAKCDAMKEEHLARMRRIYSGGYSDSSFTHPNTPSSGSPDTSVTWNLGPLKVNSNQLPSTQNLPGWLKSLITWLMSRSNESASREALV